MRLLRYSLLLVSLIVLSTAAAIAQYDTASVLGTVSDPSGALVPGSQITLTNSASNVTATRTSNASGEYEFTGVLPGNYVLTASAPGFKTERTSFSVSVGARQRADIHLETATAKAETVTVSGVAAQLETDTSDNGFTVQPREVMSLPLNGREYARPGQACAGRAHVVAGKREHHQPRCLVHRERAAQLMNKFILDGLDNNSYGVDNQAFSNQAIQPVLDAVNEFRISTDNYSAEYGRAVR